MQTAANPAVALIVAADVERHGHFSALRAAILAADFDTVRSVDLELLLSPVSLGYFP